GPQTAACRDSEGAPTKALIGFMHSVGATCENDLTETEEKGKKYIAWKGVSAGKKLADELAAIVERVLLNIPAPRLMRWGDNDFKFIRPIRGVLLLHGETHVSGEVMKIAATKTTKGHPLLAAGEIEITTAEEYEVSMREIFVIADINARKNYIYDELRNVKFSEPAVLQDWPDEVRDNTGATIGGQNKVDDESPLICEVAAMCEYPILHQRKINGTLMNLPLLCMMECMKKHQRFFPFTNYSGKLMQDYFMVADNDPGSPESMLRGYDSVLRARLRDMQFYYEEDIKIPLTDYVEKLKLIVFHQKLGNQHTRIARVCKIAATVAPQADLDFSATEIKDAAEKILAPLSTKMIDEYPDLQECMAAEYFGETRAFSFVHLCYDMEKLAGMFGVGEIPTGSKDPHGLRRDALKIAEFLVIPGGQITPDIGKFIAAAVESFDGKIANAEKEIHAFILDRIRFSFSTKAPYRITYFAPNSNIMESLLSRNSRDFRWFDVKVDAVKEFADNRKISEPLAAVNKRINNIFRKSGVDADALPPPDESLFGEEAERNLWQAVLDLRKETDSYIAENNYAAALQTLSTAAEPVDAFFEKVLVNAEDEKIRKNRFALLRELRELLNCVADISKLAA
ncbi:MAG: glycine--tRNA ligase subunit beta, partial [Betaproteobacteria bacterium]|nr:glycine--tRNA ligase subunit beta [Betaproteobacteria bacterium]